MRLKFIERNQTSLRTFVDDFHPISRFSLLFFISFRSNVPIRTPDAKYRQNSEQKCITVSARRDSSTNDRKWNNHSDIAWFIRFNRRLYRIEVVTEGDGSPANKRIPLVQQDHRTRYPALVAFYLPPKCKIFSSLLIGSAEGEREGEEKKAEE